MTTEMEITDKNIGEIAKVWPLFQLSLPVVANLVNTAYERGKAEAEERCEREARRYADFYAQGTDGRNTFIIFADAIRSQP